ncbi:hypothetical protein [Paractinoplanes lichenicola]|uniref:Uncharacterized protein n=1 Tax=Paractinoplanes lichenicola TaxID=2802976 RepID=A0ABS1VWS3_9ACTN|nr:hypothetical protein [Actinoplanes lichenicola]MBL7258935.1 hypothetical protein [Actinoplanes lichenicola]
MADEAQLQVMEFTNLSYGSLTCLIRCLSGIVRVGDRVRLVVSDSVVEGPLVDGLTVTRIERSHDVTVPFTDPGMGAALTATGDIDVRAIRATTAGTPADQLWRRKLLLVLD